MKLLVVGDGNHQFNLNLVKWLQKRGSFERIDVLTDRKIRESEQHTYSQIFSIYKGSGFRFFSGIRGLGRLQRYFLYFLLIKKNNLDKKYDYVHFHYLNRDNLFISKFFTPKNIILSIWGSDYYRANRKNRQKIVEAFKKSRYLTFTNELTKEDFRKEFGESNKYRICRFGLAPLEYLKNLDESKIESKSKIGLDENKIVLTIGYNLKRAQQHLAILDQISKLSHLKDKLLLLLPITYGNDIDYKEELINKINKMPFEYIIFDDYLDDLTISRIRNASDIMIQLQITDQFSGSMQEHLFANNIVITGSWLPYKTLKDYGVHFLEVDDVSMLAEKLICVFDNFKSIFKQIEGNSERIVKLSSWNQNISSWLKLYE